MSLNGKLPILLTVFLVLLGSIGYVFARPAPLLYPPAGAEAVHPGGPFHARFSAPVPAGATLSLVDSAGRSLVAGTRRSPDGRSLLIAPEAPLDWQAAYELCVTTDKGSVLRVLPGRGRFCAAFQTMPKRAAQGPADAPILVAEGRDRPASRYYAAILQAEGLNALASIPLDDLDEADLAGRAVLILDSADLPPALHSALASWVTEGGLLVLMRPGAALRQLFGLPLKTAGTLDTALLLPDSGSAISAGLSRAPFQIHGPVDRIAANPAEANALHGLAALWDDGGTAIGPHAVAWTGVGRGHVASFAFDLARSVILTRQGNPLWIDEERDGSEPLRPNDLFYPDFIDLQHAAVPAADELQRLLVNLIVSKAPIPLPRLWYLPDRRRAALIMAGDDHATGGGAPRLFTWLDLLSAPDCDLDAWECPRATAYLSPETRLKAENAMTYAQKGFEIGSHVDTGCEKPITRDSLIHLLRSQIEGFRIRYPDLPQQHTHRMHCLSWTGWADVPLEEREMGIRFDLNYYLWPPKWIDGRQIFLTGSGFPMPYADLNGDPIDVYQAASHLVNEDGVPQAEGIAQMLDGALGPNQYFGAFGTHYDFTDDFAQLLTSFGTGRGVALITAQQMLTWLDGRNATQFTNVAWTDDILHFDIALAPGAERASVLLAVDFGGMSLIGVTCETQKMPLTLDRIKGLTMAFFPPRTGTCAARYGG